jgi:3-phenylpropionate/trans-cinnamate dioxygenase ferredoxin subunit
VTPIALERRPIGRVEDFTLDQFRIFELDGRSIGVVRTRAGFFAIKNTCPHEGAPLCLGNVRGTMLPSTPGNYRWGREGQVVRCPWHGYDFYLESGKCVYGEVGDRAVAYRVEVDQGDVFIYIKPRRN